ncbi:LysR family transcriptional regulator [Dialister sp.]|uniref:LysR family transcriptional regulator n=1 Tax=Dialister sp. TaxID=1955814 RepID=UPI003F052C8E
MEISQLEYFVILARIRHFTRAARSMSITQSALSHSMRKLEKELGVALFERTEQGVTLTAAGQDFLSHAERSLNELKKGKNELEEMKNPGRGLIRLSFIHSLGTGLIPFLLAGYEKHCARFVLSQNDSASLTRNLLEGKNDLCLCPPMMSMENIIWVYLFSEKLYAALPRSHRLAQRKSLAVKDLEKEPFIFLKRSYNLRVLSEEFLAGAGVNPLVMYEGDDVNTLAGLISAGLGVSILPETEGTDRSDIVFIPFSDRPLTREIGLAWNGSVPLTAAADAFRQYVLSCFPHQEAGLSDKV